jgi:hypothetical protein
MTDAFFTPDGDGFVASELTRGPWSPSHQHAGPPCALLVRALEACVPREGFFWGRVSFDILRPVPIARLRTRARVLRPGRSVELVEAVLEDSEATELVIARAWRLRSSDADVPAEVQAHGRLAGPQAGEPRDFFPTGQDVGYHTATEYRFLEGAYLEPGPAIVWMRQRVPLVAGEAPSPLQRVMVVADSGNGVSAALDYRRFQFINTDLTVVLHRLPATEWICLDAVTYPEPTGVGLAETRLYDERGPIGRAVQTLLVSER